MAPRAKARASWRSARKMKPAVCRCGAEVFEGWDARAAALSITLDRRPLTAVGEMLAILAGARTYWVVGGETPEPIPRQGWHIERHPAADPRNTVLADHACGRALPEDAYRPPYASQLPDEPPF